MTRSTSEVAVCCSSDSARCICATERCFRASSHSRVRWTSRFWRSVAEELRLRPAVAPLRGLSFVVLSRRVFIATPPGAAPTQRAATPTQA